MLRCVTPGNGRIDLIIGKAGFGKDGAGVFAETRRRLGGGGLATTGTQGRGGGGIALA
jgi:hypothetical protein